MERLPVTLIVKAPNQQIEDQTIQCESTWSVNKLKHHLSEVYPSKPPHDEQKLIYSGRLLNDSLILKDILRQYDGQENYTVHLVCTPKHANLPSKSNKLLLSTTNNSPTNPEGTSPQSSSSPYNNFTQNLMDIRNTPRMIWTNTNILNRNVPIMDANQYAMHLAYMQRAYIQYIGQYMQTAANGPPGLIIPNFHTTPIRSFHTLNDNTNPPRREVQEPAAPPVRQAEPDNQERDWLDVFYMLSRALVLFSVVYFYSSPVRFIFVLFLGFTLYLYQIGFFRNINNNNINNNTVNSAPVEGSDQQQLFQEQTPTRLMVMWTFFTTFFASLIPEVPNTV